jgi:hypothetical protein
MAIKITGYQGQKGVDIKKIAALFRILADLLSLFSSESCQAAKCVFLLI